MPNSMLVTLVFAVALIVFICARQVMQRPVTRGGLLLPLVLCVALAGLFLVGHPTFAAVAAVGGGVLFGIGTGLASGQVMRVWRDATTGSVLQKGGWRYLFVIIALLLVRLLIRVVVIWRNIAVDEAALNAALIAAVVGNFVGRDIMIARRAFLLVGGSFANLPGRGR